MSTRTDATSLHLLAGAYAVDAVSDTERAAFEEHLDLCDDCRVEVWELAGAVAQLAASVSVPPPASLAEQVRRRIDRVRPLPPVVEAPLGVEASGSRSRGRRLRGLLVAAVTLAAVGTGVAVWPSGDDSPTAALVSSPAASAVLGAPDVRRSSVDFERGATATVYHSDSLGQAVLVTDGMPAAPAGEVYAVWLDQPGTGLVPAGFLAGSASGSGDEQSVVLSGDAATAEGAAITVEPVGGSSRPTGEPVASFDFGQGA